MKSGLYRFFRTIAAVIVSVRGTMGVFAQQGQPGTVRGTVLDPNNQPIVGASVIVVGTVNGTTTGIDGAFELRASEGQQLEISFVGM